MTETKRVAPEQPSTFSAERVQILPILEEIQTRLTELSAPDFRSVVDRHLREQFSKQALRNGIELSSEELEEILEKNRNKVERNTLASILIHESMRIFSKQINIHPDTRKVTWNEENSENATEIYGDTINIGTFLSQRKSTAYKIHGDYYLCTEKLGKKKFYHVEQSPVSQNISSEIDERFDIYSLLSAFFEHSFSQSLFAFLKQCQYFDTPYTQVFSRLETMLADDALNNDISTDDRETDPHNFLVGGFNVSVRFFSAMARYVRVQEHLQDQDQSILLERIFSMYNIPAFLAKQHLEDFRTSFAQIFTPKNTDVFLKNEAVESTAKRSRTDYSLEEAFSLVQPAEKEGVVATGCPALPTKDIHKMLTAYLEALAVVYSPEDDDWNASTPII